MALQRRQAPPAFPAVLGLDRCCAWTRADLCRWLKANTGKTYHPMGRDRVLKPLIPKQNRHMPVVRLNDATFIDLKSIATWLGTDTPSKTIDLLVREKMKMLDLERDADLPPDQDVASDDAIFFQKAPSLAFTRILRAKVKNQKTDKMNWAALLHKAIEIVKKQVPHPERLVSELQVPAKACTCTDDGYKFYSDLGISIQGQSTPDAWREVSRLANKYGIPIEVEFQWRDNEKALHPGLKGLIRAGGE